MADGTYHVLAFDPPATTNMGWACFEVDGDEAKCIDSGVEIISDDGDDRHKTLAGVHKFVLDLISKYDNVTTMCFERSIGGGWAPTREKLAEATGVIKMIGILNDVNFAEIHTGSMAKQLTGSGKKKGKKSRIKHLAKDMCYPDIPTFIQIANYTNDKGDRVSFFEHEADAICFGMFHILEQGITIRGEEKSFFPEDMHN